MTASKIIGLIPARNVESSIAEVVSLLRQSCSEVMVIDNASRDLTATIANRAGALVIMEPAIGKGHALRRGFRECLRDSVCGAIVTLDADGENDPSDIPRLLAPVLGCDAQVVFGVRTRTHSHIAFGHSTTGALLEAISGIHLLDPMSGIRAYSREAISQLLPALKRGGFGIDLQIAVEVVRHGIKWREVLVSGDNVRLDAGWSLDHITDAMENLLAYGAIGLFPSGRISKVVCWSGPEREILVLRTPKRDYRLRRRGRLFVPEK
jgi:glycosyltransferase involved in cell wall biosynthesis